MSEFVLELVFRFSEIVILGGTLFYLYFQNNRIRKIDTSSLLSEFKVNLNKLKDEYSKLTLKKPSDREVSNFQIKFVNEVDFFCYIAIYNKFDKKAVLYFKEVLEFSVEFINENKDILDKNFEYIQKIIKNYELEF